MNHALNHLCLLAQSFASSCQVELRSKLNSGGTSNRGRGWVDCGDMHSFMPTLTCIKCSICLAHLLFMLHMRARAGVRHQLACPPKSIYSMLQYCPRLHNPSCLGLTQSSNKILTSSDLTSLRYNYFFAPSVSFIILALVVKLTKILGPLESLHHEIFTTA